MGSSGTKVSLYISDDSCKQPNPDESGYCDSFAVKPTLTGVSQSSWPTYVEALFNVLNEDLKDRIISDSDTRFLFFYDALATAGNRIVSAQLDRDAWAKFHAMMNHALSGTKTGIWLTRKNSLSDTLSGTEEAWLEYKSLLSVYGLTGDAADKAAFISSGGASAQIAVPIKNQVQCDAWHTMMNTISRASGKLDCNNQEDKTFFFGIAKDKTKIFYRGIHHGFDESNSFGEISCNYKGGTKTEIDKGKALGLISFLAGSGKDFDDNNVGTNCERGNFHWVGGMKETFLNLRHHSGIHNIKTLTEKGQNLCLDTIKDHLITMAEKDVQYTAVRTMFTNEQFSSYKFYPVGAMKFYAKKVGKKGISHLFEESCAVGSGFGDSSVHINTAWGFVLDTDLLGGKIDHSKTRSVDWIAFLARSGATATFEKVSYSTAKDYTAVVTIDKPEGVDGACPYQCGIPKKSGSCDEKITVGGLLLEQLDSEIQTLLSDF